MAPLELVERDSALMSAQGQELRQLIDDHREQAEEGHRRLRQDLRDLEIQIQHIQQDQGTMGRRLDRVEQTPPTIEKMAWTTKQLLVVVAGCLSIGGGMWQLHTDIDKAAAAEVASAKLQEERNQIIAAQIDAALKESRLNGIKTDDLSKQLTTYLLQHAK